MSAVLKKDSVSPTVVLPAPAPSVSMLSLSLVVSPESLSLSQHFAASHVKNFVGKGFKFSCLAKVRFFLRTEACLWHKDLACTSWSNWIVAAEHCFVPYKPNAASFLANLHICQCSNLHSFLVEFQAYAVHIEKKLDQDAKLSSIWNLFAEEANSKKEASALDALEAQLKETTAKFENVFLA
ncbi:hypothetical protein DSO57_1021842 [Entomophthora muscae]|uniref:Uncharacterized protein n=1 Tax=Entomophthora muscae TaxID=34485 RepID=A0ACC2RI55_9FUNG|nr:hypothetical protein DSO57_1021842 [Entomophthora muscae]